MSTYTRGTEKLGRNALCHCGSGKKYKLCHLQADEADEALRRENNSAKREMPFLQRLRRAVSAAFASKNLKPSAETDKKLLALGRERLARCGAKLIQKGDHLALKIMVGPHEVQLEGAYAVGFARASEADRKKMLADIQRRVETGR